MHDKLMQITQQASWHDRLPRYAYLAQLVREKRVLDLGCGTGEGAALLAESGAKEVVAIDPSSASIEHARATYALPNLSFIARFVEDPLDAGQATESGEFDSSDPLLTSESFESQVTSIRIPMPPPQPQATQALAVQQAEGETVAEAEANVEHTEAFGESQSDACDACDEQPERVDSFESQHELPHQTEEQPLAVDEQYVEHGQLVLEGDAEATLADAAQVLPPSEEQPAEATLVSDAQISATAEGFDIILAINPDLPIKDETFLRRLVSFLNPDGFLVVSARIDGSHCLSDLLAHFEPGTNPGEPVAFADSEQLRRYFESLGYRYREVVQHAALSTRFAPAEEPERPIDRIFGSTAEAVPRFRLFFLFRGEPAQAEAFECHVPLEPLVAQLGEGINALVSRLSMLDHRGLLFEEQLAQKDALTDDLEEELRNAEAERRTFEEQNRSLQSELDKLQAELTEPPVPEGFIDASVLEQRDQKLAAMGLRLELDEQLLEQMREAIRTQRLTIEALTTRLQLDLPPPPTMIATVLGAQFEGEDNPDTLREQLRRTLEAIAQRDVEIAQRTRELGQIGAELERQSREASTRRSEAEYLQGQLQISEQRGNSLRGELETMEKKAQAQLKQANEKAERALSEAKLAEEQRLTWEARYTALQGQLEAMAAVDARHLATLVELRAELETARSMNERSEALLARFRRGRRERRLAAGLE